MERQEEQSHNNIASDNADIEYILDLFDSEELKLTISEDIEENERTSNIVHKKSQESVDSKQDISDAKYRSTFMNFFSNNRSEAISFIDSAIRFMNGIKKMKMQDLLQQLSNHSIMENIIGSLITPQLLIQPIEDELSCRQLSPSDVKRYNQVLELLKAPGPLCQKSQAKIQSLLGEIEAH